MTDHKFSPDAERVISEASRAATTLGQGAVGSEHLLLGLLCVPDTLAFEVLTDFDLSADEIADKLKGLVGARRAESEALLQITPRAERILKRALYLARKGGAPQAGAEHLLLALTEEGECLAAKLLSAFSVTPGDIRRALTDALREGDSAVREEKKQKGDSQTPTLDTYARDLTAAAREGTLDPIIGRQKELTRVVQILSRRTKNNPCLIGEPGVGKTAIAEGLAQRILAGQVPEELAECRVMTLDLTGMLAGAKYRGEFEERIKSVLDEVKQDGHIILFIDEIHILIGAGGAEGAIDAANILKPALARGQLQVIGATTLSEYRQIEKDAALERRFQPVTVSEPTEEEAVQILTGLREKYEAHHGVKITDEAIRAAVSLSVRYIGDRFLPDKAIDLIDEAQSKARIASLAPSEELEKLNTTLLDLQKKKAAAVQAEEYEQAQSLLEGERKLVDAIREQKESAKRKRAERQTEISEDDIAAVVTEWTGIPVSRLLQAESERLLHLEEELSRRVIGQSRAVCSLSRAIRRSRSGLKDPRRPAGSFIFAGPTGVGKTELSKAIAQLLFGDEGRLIRVDMSEFMEKHSVSKLIGSPPGYVGYEEGGELTEKVRRNPYSVILFDEIEKAHPDVFHLLLQMLDDGRLTDSHGRVVDFKNTILILTTNAGVSSTAKAPTTGFVTESAADEAHSEDERRVMSALKGLFRPEFLNRVDEIIVFERLGQPEIEQIARLILADLQARVRESGYTLTVTDEAVALIAREGFDPQYGARPLRRTVQRLVEDDLALLLLDGKYQKGDEICLRVENGALRF